MSILERIFGRGQPMTHDELVETLVKTKRGGTPPQPCVGRLFKEGVYVLQLHGPRPWMIEQWCMAVSKKAGVPVDWHQNGGIACVLVLPDDIKTAIPVVNEYLPAFKEAAERVKKSDGDDYSYPLQVLWRLDASVDGGPSPVGGDPKPRNIDLTGNLVPLREDGQPHLLSMTGSPCLYLPTFTDENALAAYKAMDAAPKIAKTVKITDGREFLDSLDHPIDQVRVVVNLRPHDDPEKRAAGMFRFAEVWR